MVPAGPYFALAPNTLLSSASTLPASTFMIDPDGAGPQGSGAASMLRVWGDGAFSSLMGTVRPNADGTWPRATLARLGPTPDAFTFKIRFPQPALRG